MKYKELIESIKIVAKCNGGEDKEVLEMWAEHDEHGIELKNCPTADELRKLASFGWSLGCDSEYDEEDWEKWENYESLSDEEIIELFKNYNGIFKFE